MAFAQLQRFRDDEGAEVLLRYAFDDHGLLTHIDVLDDADPERTRTLRPAFVPAPRRPVDSDAPLPLEIP